MNVVDFVKYYHTAVKAILAILAMICLLVCFIWFPDFTRPIARLELVAVCIYILWADDIDFRLRLASTFVGFLLMLSDNFGIWVDNIFPWLGITLHELYSINLPLVLTVVILGVPWLLIAIEELGRRYQNWKNSQAK